MTEAESVNDVSFHQPQIVSEVETIFPVSVTIAGGGGGGGGGGCTARMQSGAIELGRRLLLAARAGDTGLVLDLMAKGAPFTNDWLGTSPLHLAASHAHADTCGVLLRAGVSRESRTKVERTPLHLAAYAGHAAVAELLLQHGAQVDCRDMLRMTPLHWAAERGHTEVVAALLRHGAELRPTNKFRKTPQQLAAAKGHQHVLALIDEETKLREAAKSVRAIVSDHPPEEPAEPEAPRTYTTNAVYRNVQEVKIKQKSVQEKTAKPEIKAAKIEVPPAGAGGAEGAGAALLRRHGITLLPADDSGTVLSALQSGRTVVLSDAGKLMLKESSEPAVPAAAPVTASAATAATVAASAAGATVAAGTKNSRGVVLTATPVRTTPRGVKVFTVNNRMSVAPTEVRPRAKIMTPQDLQQVKIVQLPADARIVSPRKPRRLRVSPAHTHAHTHAHTVTHAHAHAATHAHAARTPVKIIMNKTNFERLVAGVKVENDAADPQTQQTFTIPEAAGSVVSSSACSSLEPAVEVTVLRSLLAQAQKTISSLTEELQTCRARLAHYEQDQA